MQLQTIMGRACGLDGLEAHEAPDAVIDMDHEIACAQRARLQEEILRALGFAALVDEPVAQNVLLADDGEARRLEALLQPHNRQRRDALGQAQRVGERVDALALLQTMFAQHRGQALARTIRPASDDHPLAALFELAHMGDGGLENILRVVCALGREAAAGNGAAINDEPLGGRRQRKGREARQRCGVQLLAPFLRRHVERVGLQGLVGGARGVEIELGFAGVVVIPDLREALARSVFGQRIQQQRRIAHIIEERVQLAIEQRQPMLHAHVSAAFADGFIEIVAARLGTEEGKIILAKTAHVFGGERHLRHGHQIEPAQLHEGALGLGIEGADGLQRIAEEVEADGLRQARRIEIENAAALGVFAGLAHGGGAQEAVGLEPAHEIIHVDGIAGGGGEAFARHPFARGHPLHQAIDGDAENARPVGGGTRARQTRQHGHAARGHRSIGRDAIIGLAIPGGELQRLDVGRGEGQHLHEGAGALSIARHMHEGDGAILRGAGEHAREIGGHHRVEAIGDGGQGERSALGELIGGAFEVGHALRR